MPYKIVKDEKKCSPSKPYAVVNSNTGDAKGCHPTRENAIQQLRALYRNVPDARKQNEMPTDEQLVSFLVPLQFAEAIKWQDDNKLWLQIYPFDTWDHPMYGETTIDKTRAAALKYHFDSGVRGHEVVVDYEHGLDPAKGKKAAGWYRQLDVRDDGLWGLVEFTPTAKQEIDNGEWKYFSGEHYDSWPHPQNGQTYDFVLSGGGLTNKPWVKGMLPLNFSEVMTEKQFATKTPKKPYGNVTYADPGYQSDGKKRYPLDTETHIRAAWSYINMPKNAAKYSSSQVASIKSKIKAAMKRIGAAIKQSEEAIEKELNANLMSENEATRIVDEHADVEHSEPGTGGAVDPNINRDDSADEGWRRDTPPAGEDGTIPDRSKTIEEGVSNAVVDDDDDDDDDDDGEDGNMADAELRKLLGIAADDDLLVAVGSVKERADKYDAVKTDVEEKRAFSEMFPDQAKELERLREERLEGMSKKFAEDIGKLRFKDSPGEDAKTTTLGLSGLAVQSIEETARKFTEGNVTLEDFKGSLEAIINNGIVDYGTTGSSRVREKEEFSISANDYQANRQAFSELVATIQKDDSLDFDAALKLAADREPDLFEAYRRPPVIAG